MALRIQGYDYDHAQQGGLCLVLGEPGTGKSVLKQALLHHECQ
jgi:archaellum biogenesis ATPase FlaH